MVDGFSGEHEAAIFVLLVGVNVLERKLELVRLREREVIRSCYCELYPIHLLLLSFKLR